MLEIKYNTRFIKDLKKLGKTKYYITIKTLCFSTLPSKQNISEIEDVKKLTDFKNYYRIKVDDYRIGFKIENNCITLMRVLHRKDIYRYFPSR